MQLRRRGLGPSGALVGERLVARVGKGEDGGVRCRCRCRDLGPGLGRGWESIFCDRVGEERLLQTQVAGVGLRLWAVNLGGWLGLGMEFEIMTKGGVGSVGVLLSLEAVLGLLIGKSQVTD